MTPNNGGGGTADGYPQDAIGWPTSDECQGENAYGEALAAARVELRRKRAEQEIEHAKANYQAQLEYASAEAEAERGVSTKYYDAVFEVAKGSMDRARAAAELVQKGAGAIVTLYTGVLALAFSVSDNPLPWRGLIAPFFLGLAIVLSTGFLAYLPEKAPEREDQEVDEADSAQTPARNVVAYRFAAEFIRWAREAATQRSIWLRSSVIALAVALFFLPAAFIAGSALPSEPVPWPSLATNAPANVELQKIVYTAQVTEAAQQHSGPQETASNDLVWALLSALGLLMVIVIPRVHLGTSGEQQAGQAIPGVPAQEERRSPGPPS